MNRMSNCPTWNPREWYPHAADLPDVPVVVRRAESGDAPGGVTPAAGSAAAVERGGGVVVVVAGN